MQTRIIIGLTSAAGLAIALPLLAAERLAARTGLWENTMTMALGLNLPKEQLDQLPAEMRRQMGIGTPRVVKEKSCMTEKDLQADTFRDSMQDSLQDCDYKHITNTATRQEWTFQCKAQGGTATGRMVIDVVSDQQVRASMDMRSPEATMDVKVDARWLQASCEGATTK
jgi:hypothetical protein